MKRFTLSLWWLLWLSEPPRLENATFIISIINLSNKSLRKLNMKDHILERERLGIYNSRTKWLLYPPELPEQHAVVDLGSIHAQTTRNVFFGFIGIIDLDSRAKNSEE